MSNITEHTPQSSRENRFHSEVKRMRETSKTYSFQEYLSYAAEQALIANQEGNYGIGAVYVFRDSGKEYVIGGRNGIVSRKDTHLHAEQDAIDAVESLARGEKTYADRILLQRAAPHHNEERSIITSLEPCPMCTARILTHKVNNVYIGSPDEFAGSMLDGREKGLPILWQQMREGEIYPLEDSKKPNALKVITPEKNPGRLSYVAEEFASLPLEIFLLTREAIDAKMGIKGLSDLSHLSQFIDEIKK